MTARADNEHILTVTLQIQLTKTPPSVNDGSPDQDVHDLVSELSSVIDSQSIFVSDEDGEETEYDLEVKEWDHIQVQASQEKT